MFWVKTQTSDLFNVRIFLLSFIGQSVVMLQYFIQKAFFCQTQTLIASHDVVIAQCNMY